MCEVKSSSKKIVGIDLGTTNSVVSVLEGANANVLVEKDFEENIQENCHPNEETSDEDIKEYEVTLNPLDLFKNP